MLIFLIGQSGSGKSYWAKQLSSVPGFSALDMDELISRKLAQPIIDVFKEKGESFFREKERETLHKIISEHGSKDMVVVATGGGAPCYADNMKLMLENGVVIYLQATVALLAERLKHATDRPLLAEEYENLPEILQKQLNERKDIYQQAHYKIDITTATSATFTAVILSAQNQNNLRYV